jgi:hypothetical protein
MALILEIERTFRQAVSHLTVSRIICARRHLPGTYVRYVTYIIMSRGE